MPTTLDGNSLDLGQEIFISVENISGQDVTALEPKAFAVSGASVIDPRIKEAVLALAPDLNSGIRYGLNTTDALNGGVAKIAVFGTINDVNTSAWAEGDILFVSDTTPGELVNVRPAENAFVIGMVLFSDPVHGSIEVYSGRSELIDRTTPVGLDVTWMTGDPDTEPGFYKAMKSDRGTIAELIMDVTTGDNDIAPLPHDHLSIVATTDTTIKAGEARGHLEVSVNRTAAVKRYWIEIYLADNVGSPIDAGTGLPNGDLGVPPIATLVSGLVDPPTNTNSDISLSGVVESQVIVPTNNRVRYHILCEKVGSQGGNVTHSVYFGTDHVCYIGVPKTISIGAAGNHGNVQFNQNGLMGGSDSLYWDIANNRLGIGTSTPSHPLHVAGTAFISGNLAAAGGRFQVQVASNVPTILLESAPGVLSHVFDADGDSYILNNNFGIGTDTPSTKLHVQQSVNDTDNGLGVFNIAKDISLRGWVGESTGAYLESIGGDLSFRTDGANRLIIAQGGAISVETGFTAKGSAIFESAFRINQHNETQYNKFINIYNNAGTAVLMIENAEAGAATAFTMNFKNAAGDTNMIGLRGHTGDIVVAGDISAGGSLFASTLPAGSGSDFLVAIDASGELKKSARTEDTPGPEGPEGPPGAKGDPGAPGADGTDAAWLNGGTRITLTGDPSYDIMFREDTFGRVYYAGGVKNTSGGAYTNNVAITGLPLPTGGSNNGFYPLTGIRFPTAGALGQTSFPSCYLYVNGSELRIQFDNIPDQHIESFGGSYLSVNGD